MAQDLEVDLAAVGEQAFEVVVLGEPHYIKAKPWVTFRGPDNVRPWPENGAFFAIANGMGREFVQEVAAAGIEGLNFPYVCHGVRQTFTKDKSDDTNDKSNIDHAYQATRQAVSAACAIARAADSRIGHVFPGIVEAVIPVVVVEGDIFEYRLLVNGQDEVGAVDRVWVRVPSPNDPDDPQLACIVKSDEALVALATELRAGFNRLINPNMGLVADFVAPYARKNSLTN